MMTYWSVLGVLLVGIAATLGLGGLMTAPPAIHAMLVTTMGALICIEWLVRRRPT